VRGRSGSPGRLLSWGRFSFIGTHRECFEDELIAEMRASFDPEGHNRFWEAFGRRFTGLRYEEADRRSAVDKSFIRDLFPRAKIYASLLDPDVVDHLGQVHPDTRAAVHMLEQAGLAWNGQIDPFDAGPYYGAPTAQVVPVRETVVRPVGRGDPADDAPARIVAAGRGARFRATVSPIEEEEASVRVSKEARERLGIDEGDRVGITPLRPGASKGPLSG
jgi:arginine N-succinyltransferase